MNDTMRSLARNARRTLLVGTLALAAPLAHALPCAGFSDVEDTSPFCQFVEWIRNRAITLGCGASSYCPNDAVSRLQMAAFMKRLGDALTPAQLTTEASPGALDLDASPVVCQTTDFQVQSYPRTAYADGTSSAFAPADVSFAADLVYSTDAGASWTAFAGTPNRGSAPANQWGALSDVGARSLDVGQTVRFGLRLSRGLVAGTQDLADSRCQVRVQIVSRTGTSSPF